jgi:diaminopropionate ammonia-lyase
LRRLSGLAAELHVGDVVLKDESHRFGLNAFKVLGASFAIHRWLATHDVAADAVFTTATDGNHGRAVAWMARQLGLRAVIFMPAHSVPARVAAIQNEGAQVVLVAEGYDTAVHRALEAARNRGWIVIQDTATDGYRDVPELIAAGYWTTARELESTIHPSGRPGVDVVMLHAGVGTWAAAMVQYYWHRYGEHRPRLVVVEPIEAACLLDSVEAGHPAPASGSLTTIMAGLNCGLPSTIAFDVLRQSVDAFIAIPDSWAERAMARLATPAGTDPAIVSGESGAAGLAGLMALTQDSGLEPVCRHIGLGRRSRVLVWSTEGATDSAGWERVVGRPVPA